MHFWNSFCCTSGQIHVFFQNKLKIGINLRQNQLYKFHNWKIFLLFKPKFFSKHKSLFS